MLASNAELAHKLEELEKKYDHQFKIIFNAIRPSHDSTNIKAQADRLPPKSVEEITARLITYHSSLITHHYFLTIPGSRITIYPSMLLNIARFSQLLLTGLYTGLLFGDRVGVTPIRPKLPAAAFVLYQQELHLRFGKLMPVLLAGSLLAGIILLFLLRRSYQSREFIFTTIATLCTVGVIILTRLINVPINETLMTWQASSPPENVMQLWAPWEGSHTIRTCIALLGFASLAYAVTVRSNNDRLPF